MRRGFEAPAGSRAPQDYNSGTRGPDPRSQHPADTSAAHGGIEQRQQQPTTTSRNPQPQPTLAPPREPPLNPRSPAYLQGKNPYGRILDGVHFPDAEPRVAGPPSQLGSSIEGRPRTSGSFKFTTRPICLESGRAVLTPAVDGPAPPQKSVSVKATKDLFESKTSRPGTNPPLPPKVQSMPTKVSVFSEPATEKPRQHASISPVTTDAAPPARVPSPPKNTVARKKSEPILPIPRPPPEASKRIEPSQRINPFVRQGAAPTDTSQAANPAYERQAVSQSKRVDDLSAAARDTVKDEKRASQFRTREKAVAVESPKRASARRTYADRVVQRPHPDQLRRKEARSTQISSTAESTTRTRSTRAAATDPNHEIDTLIADFGEPPLSAEKLEEIDAKNLSHDGSSPAHSFSHRVHSPVTVPSFQIGNGDDYYETHVPIELDHRSGYGRRKTKDFGYPGARVKPRSIFVSSKPLADPGNWVKRDCDHFSRLEGNETREEASRKVCRECLPKLMAARRETSKSKSRRRRAATDSSSASTISSREMVHAHCRPPRRRHHSECMPTDRCGDTFAKDLGYIIDSILNEHTNTLEQVISNIRGSQPNMSQLRRVSQDLVQRTRSSNTPYYFTPCVHRVCTPHSCVPCSPCSCRPVCDNRKVCAYRSPRKSKNVCEWQPPCPIVPPKAAEPLNVGAPGQLGPNLNDPKEELQESARSLPDLIDLVNSAADDLGVDLKEVPDAQDDMKFAQAPVEHSPPRSVSSPPKATSVASQEKVVGETQPSEDSWLQKTRRQLTELSEARSQLMDELDTIAEDLGVRLDERHYSQAEVDPFQRALSKVSTGLSRQSTHLRNKSVDSVNTDLPRLIDQENNQRRISRVLTRIQSQTRRASTIRQELQEIEAIAPEEIQEWLEVAQIELPAAIDAITAVLDSLPAMESSEDMEYVPQYGSQPETSQESPAESDYEGRYEDEEPPDEYGEYPSQRTYTVPIQQLQDRIADLERRLRRESIPISSSAYSEKDEQEPVDLQTPVLPFLDEEIEQEPEQSVLERASTRQAQDHAERFEPPIMELADEEVIQEPSIVERTATRRSTLGLSRRSTHVDQDDIPEVSSEREEAVPSRRLSNQYRKERSPSPEAVIRKATTRRQTLPVEDAPAPPSSPSSTELERQAKPASESKPLPPTRIVTELVQLPEEESPAVDEPIEAFSISRQPTRVSTLPRQDTLRRSSLAIQDASTASTSPTLLPSDLEEIIPPTSRQPTRRRSTYRLELEEEVEEEPRLERTESAPLTIEGMVSSPVASKQPTFAERRATLERALTLPSREPTFDRRATLRRSSGVVEEQPLIEEEPLQLSRETSIVTRQPTKRSSPQSRTGTLAITRQPTVVDPIDMSVPLSRQPTRRGTDFREPEALQRIATRQPTEMVDRTPTRAPTMVSRRPTRTATEPFEEPVIVQRVLSRQPTVAEESPAIELDAPRQPTIVSRKPTRQPTLPPEPQKVPLPSSSSSSEPEVPVDLVRRDRLPTSISREPTKVVRQTTILSRRPTRQVTIPTELEASPSLQESSSEEEADPVAPIRRDRAPMEVSRRPTQVERQPTSVSREPTRQPTFPSDDLFPAEPDLSLIRRDKTLAMVSCKPTRAEKQPTPPPYPVSESDESFVTPVRRDRIPSSVSRQPTHVERQPTLPLEEDIAEPLELEEPAVEPVMKRMTTRQRTEQLERRATLPSPEFEEPPVRQGISRRPTRRQREPSVVQDEILPPQEPTPEELLSSPDDVPELSDSSILSLKPATRHPTLTKRKSASPMEQESQDDDLNELAYSRKPTGTVLRRSSVVDRQTTLPFDERKADEDVYDQFPSRKASVTVSRKSTTVERSESPSEVPKPQEDDFIMLPSRRSTGSITRRPSGAQRDVNLQGDEDRPDPGLVDQAPSRQPTTSVSRVPTRMPTEWPRNTEEDILPLSRQTTTPISRQPTRVSPSSPQGIVQRIAEASDEGFVDKPPPSPSSSRHSPILDQPLAALDVYRATPTSLNERGARDNAAAVDERDDSLQANQVQDHEEHLNEGHPSGAADPEETDGSQHEPKASSRHPTLQRPPTMTAAEELAPSSPLRAEVRQAPTERRQTIPPEEIPEEEPGRMTRRPTSDLSREPASLAPPEEEDVPTELPIARAATVPDDIARQRRASSAPGIVAPPVQALGQPHNQEMRPMKRRPKPRKLISVAPEEQYPPAPRYPVRDTPAWTRPDAHTPPPKPKREDEPQPKRKIVGWIRKPKEHARDRSEEVRAPIPQDRPSVPFRDPPRDQPFRSAAPGRAPGGTPQRPREFRPTPRPQVEHPRYPHRRAPPVPIPRPEDYRPRPAPVFVAKDDYYPREPLLPTRRDVQAPVRRDVQPRPRPPPPPPPRVRYPRPHPPSNTRDANPRDPPPSTSRDPYPRYQAPPTRDFYPRERPRPARPRPDNSLGRQASPRPLHREAPGSSRRQPQPRQAVRHEEEAPFGSQTPLPRRRPEIDEQSPRQSRVPEEETIPGPVRGDVQESSEEGAEEGPARSRQTSKAQNEAALDAQGSRTPPRRSHEEEPRRRSSAWRGGQGQPEAQADENPEDGITNANSDPQPEGQDNDSRRKSFGDGDGTSREGGRPFTEIPRSSSSPSRAGVTRTPDAVGPPPSRTATRKTSTREANPLSRTQTRRPSTRRASIVAEDPSRTSTEPPPVSRRPSTALNTTRRRSSIYQTPSASRAPTLPTRTPTLPPQSHNATRRLSTSQIAPDFSDPEEAHPARESPPPAPANRGLREGQAPQSYRDSPSSSRRPSTSPEHHQQQQQQQQQAERVTNPRRSSTHPAKIPSLVARQDSVLSPVDVESGEGGKKAGSPTRGKGFMGRFGLGGRWGRRGD